MKKVLLITTGGTIASQAGENGLEPQIASDGLLSFIPEITGRFEIDTMDLLNLDSSNIQAEEWQKIAHAVMDNLESYDGIVITHGTDTMAYTASMLSFMLQNLKKPVVLTGSQVPIDSMLTDARTNLCSAFESVNNGISGVTIAFDHKIIRGCRAVKVRTMGFEAFKSVNSQTLGKIYANGTRLAKVNVYADPGKPTVLKDAVCNDVFLLKLIPGTNPAIFDMLKKMRYRGIVLETFGAGGMHFVRRNLIDAIKSLLDNGIAVVACSQCLYDTSDFSIYEVGQKLMECGIIPGRDMTTEAVVTKLMWALGQTENLDEVRRIFDTDYAGEVTL